MNTPVQPAPIDKATRDKAEQLIASGRAIAVKVCPYFRPLILKMVPRETPGLGTVGITQAAIFIYDPIFVARQTPKKMAGLFVHETLHLWNRHSKRRGTREHRKFNRNADRAINPPIVEMGLELPDGIDVGCFPKDLGARDGLSAEEYYALDKDDSSEGGPCCGSGAGNPLPGEPDGDDAEGRGDSELERASRTVSELVREAGEKSGNGRGEVPEAWRIAANANLEPPKVPWQTKLRCAVRGGVGHTVGAVTQRYDFPSRRQAGLGFGAGAAVLPRLRAPIPDVWIALDTSGSMLGTLPACLAEVRGVLKALGVRARFAVCDAEVHALVEVTNVEQAIKSLKGGGGTDFRPVFEAMAKDKRKPDVLVFLTDGAGAYPSAHPVGTRVIWCVLGKYTMQPPWGDIININD